MNNPTDLNKLSHAEKDAIIIKLRTLVKELLEKVAVLEGKLALNSRNSSKPPSSDGFAKPKPKSLRKAGENPLGGQTGHKFSTLQQTDSPDYVIIHSPPSICPSCLSPVKNSFLAGKRQVFDLPQTRYEVTEHQILESRCSCGCLVKGVFPSDVTASAQYGPRALAAMALLNQHQMLPLQRTAGLMSDFFGLKVSEATVLSATNKATAALEATVATIAEKIQTTSVVHADETGLFVGSKRHWMHVLTTNTLTYVAQHAKRGSIAFKEIGVLPNFKGILVHDGWKPYRSLECSHSLCNAHHLRELTYLYEEMKQEWAQEMIELLTKANTEVNQSHGVLSSERLLFYRDSYNTILSNGDTCNPPNPTSSKKGRTAQSKGANLIARLRAYHDDVWRFASDKLVPFTNNSAEQAVRMPKVKQKISGCFRTVDGANAFCTIRSYLATMQKQGNNLFEALCEAFNGNVQQPVFV